MTAAAVDMHIHKARQEPVAGQIRYGLVLMEEQPCADFADDTMGEPDAHVLPEAAVLRDCSVDQQHSRASLAVFSPTL